MGPKLDIVSALDHSVASFVGFMPSSMSNLGYFRKMHWALGVVMNLNLSSENKVFFFAVFLI